MPTLPFPEWLPDLPQMSGLGSSYIRNCRPQTAQSYGPMPTPGGFGQIGDTVLMEDSGFVLLEDGSQILLEMSTASALTSRCQGSYSIKDTDGLVSIFAGDAHDLYRIPPNDTAFAVVSKTPAVYNTPTVAELGFWSMTSFGDRVIATNGVDPVQSMLASTDTLFSDLSADAPIAKYAATMRDFLFLGYTTDDADGTVPYRVHWSAIGDPMSWPEAGSDDAIAVQSDFQDLQQSDLGSITGMIGGYLASADGCIFMERGIYRVAYGGRTIFTFAVAQGAAGTRSPLSIVPARLRTTIGTPGVCFYIGGDEGIYAFDGGQALPIGAQKFDRAFFRECDPTYLNYAQGVADPALPIVYWAFAGVGSTDGLYNRLLVYNWDLNRGTLCDLSATPLEWMTRAIYGHAYTLDELDPFGTLDTLPASLDSPIWAGKGVNVLSAFDSTHFLSSMTGPPLSPVIETSETQLTPARRTRIMSARGVVDAANYSISVGHRETTGAPVVYEAAIPVNIIGECPQRVTGRYVRFRMTLPAGQTFTHLQGIDVDARPDSARR